MIDEAEARARGYLRVGKVWRVAPGFCVQARTMAELEAARAAHYAARAEAGQAR